MSNVITEWVLAGNKIQCVYEEDPTLHFFSTHWMMPHAQMHEASHEKGIAHLISTMLTRGCKKYTEDEIEKLSYQYQIDLEGVVSNHYLGVQSLVLSKHWDKALDLMKDVFTEPLFEMKKIQQQVQIIIDQIQKLQENPDDVLFESFFKNMFAGHPYGNSLLGEKETLSSLTSEKLKSWYRQALQGNPFVISMVGPNSVIEVQNKIKQMFQESLTEQFSIPTLAHPVQKRHVIKEEKSKFQKTYGIVGFYVCDSQSYDRYALEWIRNIWINSVGGVLFEKIREEMGLVYHIDASVAFLQGTGCFYVHFNSTEKNCKPIFDIIEMEIKNLQNNLLSEEQFQQIKNNLEGSWTIEWDCPLDHLQYFDYAKLVGEPVDIQKEKQRLFQVTRQDIQRVAKQYFTKPYIQITLAPGDFSTD